MAGTEQQQPAADAGKARFAQVEREVAERGENLIQLKFAATGFEITPAHVLGHLRAIAEEGHTRHGLSDDSLKEVTESCDRIQAAFATLTADQLREIVESLRSRPKNP